MGFNICIIPRRIYYIILIHTAYRLTKVQVHIKYRRSIEAKSKQLRRLSTILTTQTIEASADSGTGRARIPLQLVYNLPASLFDIFNQHVKRLKGTLYVTCDGIIGSEYIQGTFSL